MFCPNCGKEMKDTNKFCTNCGMAIKRPPVMAQKPISVETPTSDELEPTPIAYQSSSVESCEPDNISETPEKIRPDTIDNDFKQRQENKKESKKKKIYGMILISFIVVVILSAATACVTSLITEGAFWPSFYETVIGDSLGWNG